MLFAFTLVELHVILPSYVHDFLQASGNVYASAEVYYSIGAIFSGILIMRLLSKFHVILFCNFFNDNCSNCILCYDFL